MVDTQNVYDDLYSLPTRQPNGDIFYGQSLELSLFDELSKIYIVKWNKYKQRKAKWRVYIADIPIIPLQNYRFY